MSSPPNGGGGGGKKKGGRTKSPPLPTFVKAEDEKETCDALCSLMMGNCSDTAAAAVCPEAAAVCSMEASKRKGGAASSKTCPKQLQLPMFLSKTYHMINTCDSEIATWSESGDNFVVKNVDQFASAVLPRYFKHSNFSSFARQLNFYGFRKLRTDPILTSDVDPQTSCYVRFFHEKFQRDKPELLHDIKRATKTDQQSKDDVESLKVEVARLKEQLNAQATEYDRRLAELSYDFNRRISATNAEFDKLAALVQQQQQLKATEQAVAAATAAAAAPPATMPSASTTAAALAAAAAASRRTGAAAQMPDLLHCLSHIADAVSLQNSALLQQHQQQQFVAAAASLPSAAASRLTAASLPPAAAARAPLGSITFPSMPSIGIKRARSDTSAMSAPAFTLPAMPAALGVKRQRSDASAASILSAKSSSRSSRRPPPPPNP